MLGFRDTDGHFAVVVEGKSLLALIDPRA